MSDRYRLLLVDDVQLMRGITKNYFSQSEFQISTAREGKEALRMAVAIRPHLIIMDSEMPGMDGVDCCRSLKNNPDLFTTPVILMTDNDPAKLARCWSSGCDGLLTRPLGRRELLSAARQYVALANRAAPRIDHNILVKYGVAGDLSWHDYAHNLGTGGLFLATDRVLDAPGEFEVEFFIPRAEAPTRCKARIAWLNLAENKKRADLPVGIGFEFVDLDRDVHHRLQQFVLNAARLQLGKAGAEASG